MIPPSKPSDAQRLELAGPAPAGPEFPAEEGLAASPAVSGAAEKETAGTVETGTAGTAGTAGTGFGTKSRLLGEANEVPVDLIRRITVSMAAAAAAVITLVLERADGAFVDQSADAILGSSGSLLAPAVSVWWMWLPVIAAWLGYALYQWLPRQRENPRHERFGWFVLASQVLAFAWLLAVSSGNAGVLLPVAAAQIAVGLVAVHSMNLHPPSSGLEGILADAPLKVSLAAGVISVLAVLSIILTRAEADLAGWGANVWALIGLITVMVGITVICMTDRGHLSLALAIVWGLSCIAFERLTGAPDSIGIGVGAAVAAFLVLVSAGSRRHQVDHERRRSERQAEARRQQGFMQQGSAQPDSTQPANI